MTNRIWALATLLVIAAVVILGWLLGVSPLLNAAAAADADRVTVEQNNQAQTVALAQMKADFERLDELQTQIDSLKLSIPNEVDSDYLYSYLSGLDALSIIDDVNTGEAQVYGIATPADGSATVAPATTDPATGDPAAVPATVPGVENLYTVPVTITFRKGVTGDLILAYAGLLQNGPRIFVITKIGREVGVETSGTITAYMFVISAPDDSPGSTFGEYVDLLKNVKPMVIKPWGPDGTAPLPTPTESATPDPSGTETPTPTPTSTTGP
jgi:hypothetical protein